MNPINDMHNLIEENSRLEEAEEERGVLHVENVRLSINIKEHRD